jgi:inosine triphosphate pyrophosphatase
MTDLNLTFVTGNDNKVREAEQILGFKLKRRKIDLIEIQGTSYEVLVAKVEEAYKAINGPVMVEDTSLGFDVLNNLPGPFIKYFEQIGYENMHKMLIGFDDYSANAICMIGIKLSQDSVVIIFEGIIKGSIGQVTGTHGFGWDPIFTPTGFNKTFAEMTPEEKQSCSHRFEAFKKLKSFLHSTHY